MNIEEMLERIDVPPTDVGADVRRGERALTRRRRRRAVAGLAAATAAVIGVAVVSSNSLWTGSSGSGTPAHSSTASPTADPSRSRDPLDARTYTGADNAVVRANVEAVAEILDPDDKQLIGPQGSWMEDYSWTDVQAGWRVAGKGEQRDVEVRLSAGWRSIHLGCTPDDREAAGCREVTLPGGITARVQEGLILTYSYERPDGYIVTLTLYGNRANQPLGFTEEQVAALLTSEKLDIPGEPPVEGPAMSDEVAKTILLDLLGEDAGQLDGISSEGPGTAVTGTWTVVGQPNASLHVSVTPAADGLGTCDTDCEQVDIDGKSVTIEDLESAGVTGYAAFYPGPKQGLYVEFILKPGADELGLSKERLAEIAADDSWQQ